MSSADDLRDVHPGRQVFSIALAFAATIPGLVIRLGHIEVSHPVAALLYGLAIVGAAFMLSWAAEVAQLDISAGLAIAVLAFIAVLPEYAVDLVFAFKAGQSVAEWGPACRPPDGVGETPCSLALANMTGANRLLIGIGWSMVVFIAWYRSRAQGTRLTAVGLERSHAIELSYLAVATAYSLTLPLKSTVTLLDAAVLVGIFVLYTIRIAGAPAEEPHLVGPARYLGTFRRRPAAVHGRVCSSSSRRRSSCWSRSTSPRGWWRPVAISRSASSCWCSGWRRWHRRLRSCSSQACTPGGCNTNAGLGTLVSSKVNQWTLLVGTLPIVFALASGGTGGLPVESRQREELLLTAAQSVFAVATLSSLSISLSGGGAAVRAVLRPVRRSAASCRRRGTAWNASVWRWSTCCSRS